MFAPSVHINVYYIVVCCYVPTFCGQSVEQSRLEVNEVIYDSDVEMAVEGEDSLSREFTSKNPRLSESSGSFSSTRPKSTGAGFIVKIANLSSSVSEQDLEVNCIFSTVSAIFRKVN